MNIFFDVDYTLLSFDQVLRRGTAETFCRLVDDGHRVFIWSGLGIRWAVVHQHGLLPYVSGVFAKPLEEFDHGLERFGIKAYPDFVVDDYPEIVRHFGGYHIPEFYGSGDNDDEMQSVYQAITEVADNRPPSHPRCWPGSRTAQARLP